MPDQPEGARPSSDTIAAAFARAMATRVGPLLAGDLVGAAKTLEARRKETPGNAQRSVE